MKTYAGKSTLNMLKVKLLKMFAGDFNMNVLDYEYNGEVKRLFDLVYQLNLIPTINEPTRVGKNSATAIGLLYKAKSYIDKHSLLSLYHSYIHSYINYGNIAWGSTTKTNIKKIYSQQKHAVRI